MKKRTTAHHNLAKESGRQQLLQLGLAGSFQERLAVGFQGEPTTFPLVRRTNANLIRDSVGQRQRHSREQ